MLSLRNNIRTYYLYSTFAQLIIVGPILVLYFIAKGLSFTEIFLIQSVASISIVIFEVPTGAIADKFGRKWSLLLGAFLAGVSLLLYVVGTEFLTFVIAEIIFSLGLALKSGADTALIYDSLKNLGSEKKFQEIEGKAKSLSLYAQAIGSILAGFLYEINIHIPMIISIGFMFLTALITLYFNEPDIEEKEGKYGARYLDQIKESGKYILNHAKIKSVILFSMVFYIFYRTGFWFFSPYMESVQIPVRYFGIIFFFFNITAALTSKRSHLIMQKTKPRTLTFMAFLLIGSFLLLGSIKVWFGVFAILLQQIARGLYRPVITKYLNKHIRSDQRATILSFQSVATSIAMAVVSPFLGILKDRTDIFTTHLILAGTMIICIYFTLQYMNKRLAVKQHVTPNA